MLSIPIGYVLLTDAFDAIGRDGYDKEWLGSQADALAKITSEIRYKGPRSPEEKAIVSRADKANKQRWAVIESMRRDFLGNPPSFYDAVPVFLLSDKTLEIVPLRPQIWINDQEGHSMLGSGRAYFHSASPNWQWSPTGDQLSGVLLLEETVLPGRGRIASERPISAMPVPEHRRDVISAIILANTALGETIAVLRENFSVLRGAGDKSLKEEIGFAEALNLTERATDCLTTACAARNLTMIVQDPRTPSRHAIPSEYFDQRPLADIEFSSALFRAYELSEQVVADPLFKLVRPFRGWVHGFIDSEFRAWLKNREIGPLAGSRMRPVFHAYSDAGAVPDLAELRHATAPTGRKRLAYIGALQSFVATRNQIALAGMDDHAVTQQFVLHIEARATKGAATPPLPGLRAIRKQIALIRQRCRGAAPNATKGTTSNGT